jgi:hypothetical protein
LILNEEHEYQHHKPDESRVQLRKWEKLNDGIDDNLELLLNDYKGGQMHSRFEDKNCQMIFVTLE